MGGAPWPPPECAPRGHSGQRRACVDPRRAAPRGSPEFQLPRSPPAPPRTRANGPISDSPMVGPFPPAAATDSPRVMPENPLRFKKLELVARGGIEPPTRGFSVRRRARFGASKPRTENAFLRSRPNRPSRPTPCRTEARLGRSSSRCAHAGQRLARHRTELLVVGQFESHR
jgi:hypothetical protein